LAGLRLWLKRYIMVSSSQFINDSGGGCRAVNSSMIQVEGLGQSIHQ